MALPKELTSIKRFGPRYGRTSRHKFAVLERQQKKIYKCPYCAKEKVKRMSIGIWRCQKCYSKFTGKAYTLAKQRSALEGIEPETTETQQEQKQEDKKGKKEDKKEDKKENKKDKKAKTTKTTKKKETKITKTKETTAKQTEEALETPIAEQAPSELMDDLKDNPTSVEKEA